MKDKDQGLQFSEQYPEINDALMNLRERCQAAGHLDPKTSMLVKLAAVLGAGLENPVKAHTAKAVSLGISEDQIEEAILVNLSTIGYAKTVVALNWVRQVTGKALFT